MIDFGEPVSFDPKDLPSPDVKSFSKRGGYWLLPCGAKASVAIDRKEAERFAQATNLEEYQKISDEIIASKSFFVVHRSPEAYGITQYLESRDLSVERLRQNGIHNISLEENEYISERLGNTDLQRAIENAPADQRLTLLGSYARLMAGVHLADVVYGNNHFGNVICGDNSAVSLIDFETSSYANLNWKEADAESVFLAFFNDLAPLKSNLQRIGCSEDEIAHTQQELVNNYPLTDEKKKALLERL